MTTVKQSLDDVLGESVLGGSILKKPRKKKVLKGFQTCVTHGQFRLEIKQIEHKVYSVRFHKDLNLKGC